MTEDDWEYNLAAYRAAGWEDDPDERDRMFWEAGFRQGLANRNGKSPS